MSKRPWTEEEDEFIRSNWKRLNAFKIAESMGTGRTGHEVYLHSRSGLGLPGKGRGGNGWDKDDIATIRAYAGKLLWTEIGKMLKTPRPGKIVGMKARSLGISGMGKGWNGSVASPVPPQPTPINAKTLAATERPALRPLTASNRRASDWRLAIIAMSEMLKVSDEQGADWISGQWSPVQRERVLASLDDLICKLTEFRAALARAPQQRRSSKG